MIGIPEKQSQIEEDGPLFVAAVAAELGELPGFALGVGPVAAAVGAARLLAARPVGHLVLVGTAGSLPGGPPVGTVVLAGTLGMADPTATLACGYVPLAPPVLIAEPLPLPIPTAAVVTRLGVTTDRKLAALLAREGPWQVEHMEAYAVAWACREAGVRFSAVLGITNLVGPDAHAEWLARRAGVEAAVRALLAPLVARG